MHTEEEARKLWCPFARSLPMRENASGDNFETLPPHNRTIDEGGKHFMDTARCIASECAAWRWERGWIGTNSITGVTHRTSDWNNRYVSKGWEYAPLKGKGFCGLAGMPS